MRSIWLVLLLLLVSLSPVHAQRWTPPGSYLVIDLGPIQPAALNDAGQVVGTDGARALLWQSGRLTVLPALSSGKAAALAISERGLVAGWSRFAEDDTDPARGTQPAVLWSRDGPRRLGHLSGGVALAAAVNDAGLVAGYSFPLSPRETPVAWGPGWIGTLELTLPAIMIGQAAAVSRGGLIVGTAGEPGDWNAWTWAGEVGRALPRPPLASSAGALAVNGVGTMVVGWASTPDGERPVRWRDRVPELLGAWGRARGVNDLGQIVGDGPYGPWLADSSRRVIELQRALRPFSGWTLRSAVDVSNRGIITGWGLHNGRGAGFLLVPTGVGLPFLGMTGR
jgi:uncharacterized membrane protein